MTQEVISKIEELKSAFEGVFNQDEKSLIEAIRMHAVCDQVHILDDLLTNRFGVENSGYMYNMLEQWAGEIESGDLYAPQAIRCVNYIYSAWSKYKESGDLVMPEHAMATLPVHVLYATERVANSVWTVAYVLMANKALVVCYGDQVEAGIRYDYSLANLKIVETEDRTLTHIFVDGALLEVINPRYLFNYRVDMALSSDIEMAAKREVGLHLLESNY